MMTAKSEFMFAIRHFAPDDGSVVSRSFFVLILAWPLFFADESVG